MEGSDGSSGDEVAPQGDEVDPGALEELEALEQEVRGYEDAFSAFRIRGYGMTGDSKHGFSYEP